MLLVFSSQFLNIENTPEYRQEMFLREIISRIFDERERFFDRLFDCLKKNIRKHADRFDFD
jgi:hypothetical protein